MNENPIFSGMYGRSTFIMKNRITKLEAEVYRNCHHDFEGLTIREAAIRMELRRHIVRRLLKSLKRKAPQLFPILSKRQFQVYQMVVEHGLTQAAIAATLGVSQSTIHDMVNKMKEQGVSGLHMKGLGDVVSYDNSMDGYIKQKF